MRHDELLNQLSRETKRMQTSLHKRKMHIERLQNQLKQANKARKAAEKKLERMANES